MPGEGDGGALFLYMRSRRSQCDGVKTNTRTYKGYFVTSFKLAQLGDSECTGTSWSVYRNEFAYRSGCDPLSVREPLFTFADVKQFIAEVSA